mmetsp:Transcript_89680/g.141598  ORF Transcript_89680/g.141598 Transcript_89680/m.141598 type:complete len:103 (-) Transcript_89680:192-500(-)
MAQIPVFIFGGWGACKLIQKTLSGHDEEGIGIEKSESRRSQVNQLHRISREICTQRPEQFENMIRQSSVAKRNQDYLRAEYERCSHFKVGTEAYDENRKSFD